MRGINEVAGCAIESHRTLDWITRYGIAEWIVFHIGGNYLPRYCYVFICVEYQMVGHWRIINRRDINVDDTTAGIAPGVGYADMKRIAAEIIGGGHILNLT